MYGGIITHSFITCKLHLKPVWQSPPTNVVNYPWKSLRGVDNKIFTIYNAELYNSVKLLCGTTAAELNNLVWVAGVAHIFQRQWRTMLKNRVEGLIQSKLTANFWKMNAFKDSANTERWVSGSKWGKTYASAPKREKCVSTQMQSQKTSPINCTEHPKMHRTPNRN